MVVEGAGGEAQDGGRVGALVQPNGAVTHTRVLNVVCKRRDGETHVVCKRQDGETDVAG